jgi:mRNA interferase RelE/StbE
MNYAVFLLRRAQSQLSKLPPEFYNIVKDTIRKLADDARPPGCKKLVGREGWRIRIGDYRVIYEIDDDGKVVTILDR